MYNKYIVIITAENKEKYIANTIFSCLKNYNKKNLRILITYTNLKNEKIIKNKFKNYKNIIFVKSLLKKNNPIHDQLEKIKRTIKFIKNEWVLLLDGDDLFISNKIKILDNLNLNRKNIYLHNHEIKFGKNKKINILKKYKYNFLYKKLFNDWPQKIATSSIIVSGNLLKQFYKNYNPFKWKYLAIDIQIILFYL